MPNPKSMFGITTKMDLSGLKKLEKESPEIFQKAQEKAGLQFLTWCNTGSTNTSKKPPIRYGVLRGSSTVFVGNKLVSIYEIPIRSGSKESPSPLRSYSGKPGTITIVYNTDYAHRMHEHRGGWGQYTLQDHDAGAKWLEEHLEKDRNDLMELIAEFVKGELE